MEQGRHCIAQDYTFIYGAGNEDYHLGTGFFVRKRIM
jgi:hypothetical protein